MRSAVRRVSLMADERLRSIKVAVREGEVELTSSSGEEGEGTEVVPAEYSGEEATLGFNWQYLTEFLNNVGAIETMAAAANAAGAGGSGAGDDAASNKTERPTAKRIRFDFKDANGATQMSVADETAYDYRYIVMPLRI